MENQVSPYDRLDSYLEKLEAQEKAKRKRAFAIIAFSVVLVLSGVYFAYQTYFSSPPIAEENNIRLRRYAAEELNPELVQKLFVTDPNSIVIIHPVTGVDTIQSMDDYYQFLNRLTMLDMDSEDVTVEAANEGEMEEESKVEQKDPEFLVEVEGEKKVGERLVYTIQNYDPGYELLLDFGNGIVRKPKQGSYTYKYPLPGHFDFHLKMVKDGEEEIIQTIKYQIFPKEEVQADQGASNTQETTAS